MRNSPVRAHRPSDRRPVRALAVAAVLGVAGLGACSSSDEATTAASSESATSTTGIRVVAPADAAAIIEAAPAGLVVLDVRTPAEFAEGHLEGAINVDYNAADFAEQVGALDPDVPYVLYCRSGNRSAGAREVMTQLGFSDVADVEGGITAWEAAGLPVVS